MPAKSSESMVFKVVRRTEKKPEKLSRAMLESILAGMC